MIGGGAAGFFCALTAASHNPGLQVIIIEKNNKLLSKVKISGGGRCNVTHACFDIPDMSRRYPRGQHFVKKAFHRFFTTDTIEWFRARGVELKAESDGRMFPVTDSSQTIIDCLLREASKLGIDIRMNTSVSAVRSIEKGGEKILSLETNQGVLEAAYICVATGGYPKASMFDWLSATGHQFETPVPSLFTFNLPGNPLTTLMGVVVEDAKVKLQGSKLEQRGPVLITHWGLSGPAILRLSAWGAVEFAARDYQFTILVNWLPDFNEQTLSEKFRRLRIEHAARHVHGKNPFGLPQRFWEFIALEAGIKKELRWADLPAKEQNRFIRLLCAAEIHCKGKTTFKDEFVTAGGIRTEEIDPGSMKSRLVDNLYFAGEVMNVDGITGGFNFQHAWTSGYVAGLSIAESSR